MKKIINFIKETILTTLLTLFLWAFVFNLILFLTYKGYRDELNIITFFWTFLIAIPLFGKFLHMFILYIGFFNYKIDQLCKKHSISLALKNVSKKINFFWFYFFRSSIAIVLLFLMNYSGFILGKTKMIFRIEEVLKIKNKDFLDIRIEMWILYFLFALIYVYFFYFLADKLIGFYKKRKSLKSKSLSQIKT